LFSRLRAHLRTPLYRNGYALTFSSGATSFLGLFYWVLAARFYSPEVVGLNSALLSAMLFLSGISQLSLNGALVRFLPTAGHASRRLIAAAYLSSLAAALVSGLVFSAGIRFWSPELRFLASNPWLFLFFIASITVWCIFSLQDSVLTGLRQAIWVPVENIAFAVAKIVLLVMLSGWLHQYGIFTSWVISVALLLLPVNGLIVRKLLPAHIRSTQDRAVPLVRQQIVKYVSGNFLGTLFYMASTTLLPVLVTVQAGTRANAYFYLPWMITTSVQLIAINMTSSYTVEASMDESKKNVYIYRVLVRTLQMLLPIVIAVLLLSPNILLVFGQSYAVEGAGLLRLFALSTIPNSVVLLYLGRARVQNRVDRVVLVQGVSCILVLGASYFALGIFGIIGVGVVWLATQTALAIALLFTELRPVFLNRELEV
jgi:O-antigen/teichoic acid export membrane protein